MPASFEIADPLVVMLSAAAVLGCVGSHTSTTAAALPLVPCHVEHLAEEVLCGALDVERFAWSLLAACSAAGVAFLIGMRAWARREAARLRDLIGELDVPPDARL